MNVIAIASLLFALSVSACAHLSESYADKLAGDPKLARHAEHFRSTYSSKEFEEVKYGYRAILSGEALSNIYDRLNEAPGSAIVSKMELIHDALVRHLAIHSEIWSDAIADAVDKTSLYRYNKLTSEMTSTYVAIYLATTRMEYTRLQVWSKIDSLMDQLKDNLVGYEQTKYPNTYELYGILSQLSDLAKEPKGSLRTFNTTVNNLRNDFSKTLALAELEF